MPMQIETLDPIPAGENPFIHDQFHMGTKVGTNVTIMFARHDSQKQGYMIIINTETGERFKIHFDAKIAKKDGRVAQLSDLILSNKL